MSFYIDTLKNEGYLVEGEEHVFNEVYFGKNKYLLKGEEILGEIRTKYRGKDEALIGSAKGWNDFNTQMEKAFKLESFCVDIMYNGLINAATIPVTIIVDAPNYKEMSANEHGFNYNNIKGSFILVYLTTGLLFSDIITDEEIMSFILHEIGHNFQANMSPMSSGYNFVRRMMNIVLFPIVVLGSMKVDPLIGLKLFQGSRRWYSSLIDKWRNEDNTFFRTLNVMQHIFSKIIGLLGLVMHSMKNILLMLSGGAGIELNLNMITKAIMSVFAFNDESIADNFATAYGYGPALSSAFVKAKSKSFGWIDEEILRQIPLLNAYFDFCKIPTNLVMAMIGDHPQDVYRIKSQLDMLENELKKSNLSPKMKNVIKSQVKEIKKDLDQVTDITEEGFYFTNALQAFYLTLFNGDWRSGVTSKQFDNFDREYDRMLNLVKTSKQGK